MRATGRPGRRRCPVHGFWEGRCRCRPLETADQSALCRLDAQWRGARPGVLRAWHEHCVVRPDGPGRAFCAPHWRGPPRPPGGGPLGWTAARVGWRPRAGARWPRPEGLRQGGGGSGPCREGARCLRPGAEPRAFRSVHMVRAEGKALLSASLCQLRSHARALWISGFDTRGRTKKGFGLWISGFDTRASEPRKGVERPVRCSVAPASACKGAFVAMARARHT